MERFAKHLTLCLVVILAVSSLLVVLPSNAQTIPKPSVPEITVEFVNRSYNVPPSTTTTTNPYSGEKIVTTKEGFHIQNDSFVITINSQPISSQDASGKNIRLFYVVQSKGHFSTYWKNLTYVGASVEEYLPTDNGYAKIVMELNGNNGTKYYDDNGYSNYHYDGTVDGQYGGQVDFRAQTVVGYTVTVQDEPNPFNIRHPYHIELVVLQTSDWSPTQTVIIPATNTPSPSPTVPEFPITLSLVAVLAAVSVLLVIGKRKLSFNR
jgi:hypothetical protein